MFKLSAVKIIKKSNHRMYRSKVNGVIVLDNGVFKVVSNSVTYLITSESFDCYGKKVIYTTRKHPIKHARIIREEGNRVTCNSEFYLPFKEGMTCIGRLCSFQGRTHFHIISSHNPQSETEIEESAKVYKMFEDVEQECKV